jgi:hypothetical protein
VPICLLLKPSRPRVARLSAIVGAATLALLPAMAAEPAAAAPLPATYTARASGIIQSVDVNLVALNLARAELVNSIATVASPATPPVTATSSNLAAQAGTLASRQSNTETAPPTHSQSGTLLAASGAGITTGNVSYTDTVRFDGVNACVPAGSDISRSVTRTSGSTVSPAGVANVSRTGVSTTTARTLLAARLVANDTRSVVAQASGQIAGLTFLADAVRVNISGQPTLTATATGVATGSSVTYVPPTAVTATVGGVTRTLTPGTTVTLRVPGVGSVDLHVNSSAEVTRTIAANGLSAAGNTAVVTATVRLLGLAGVSLGTVTEGILPLTVAATAPAGGVECLAAAPRVTITTPANGSTTTDPTPRITGTTDPGNTVKLSIDGKAPITATVNPDGTYTATSPHLTDGRHTIVATATNPAGRTATATTTFTVNSATRVTITAPADGSTTSDPTPPITGTTEPGNTVKIRIDGGAPITVAVNPDGTYSLISVRLTDGPHTIVATATDPAGNTATASTRFTVDTKAPAIAITSPADGSTTADSTPTIRGVSSVRNGTITLTIDGRRPVTVRTDASGRFAYTSATLTAGPHTVLARATDAAGNTATDRITFTVTPAAPPAPGGGGGSGGGGLAFTGSDPAPLLGLASLLLVSGTGLVAAARRRSARIAQTR